jgi:hypothetical protein
LYTIKANPLSTRMSQASVQYPARITKGNLGLG